MAQENIKVTLPDSGLEAEIRPYVRRKDEKRVDKAVFGDETADIPVGSGVAATIKEVKIKLSNTLDVADIEVMTMLIRLGENQNPTKEDVEELSSKDYQELLDIVDPMFDRGEKGNKEKK